MPYTQNLEFSAATNLTLNCKLFANGSDTVVASGIAIEKTNDKNRYVVTYTDIPTGTYRLNAFVGNVGGFANETFDIELIEQTFYPRSESALNLSSVSAITVERSLDDDKNITFAWPTTGAMISGQKSVDNGPYSPVSGAINYLRSENGRHYYTLDYNAADRINEEATIRYKMADNTYEKYFNLRLIAPGITTSQIENALMDDFNAITNTVTTRTLPSGEYLTENSQITVSAITKSAVEDIFSTFTLPESYAPSGAVGTPAQILYFMQQTFSQFAISGVYISVKKLDGTTEAAKFIMNDKEVPTSRTRVL